MGTHPIFESDFDCLTAKWDTRSGTTTVTTVEINTDGSSRTSNRLRSWPDSVDTTKNVNNAKDWFPYGLPWGEDIWKIWGREGLVKRPAKVTRAMRKNAKLSTWDLVFPDHCQEFWMQFQKCQRDTRQKYGQPMDIAYGGGLGNCTMSLKASADCERQEQLIAVALYERIKRIQDNMDIKYMPRGWF